MIDVEYELFIEARRRGITKFEFFKEQCKDIQFLCHIFYKDETFITIENDLPRLMSVDENHILLFQGVWAHGKDEYYDLLSRKGFTHLSTTYVGDIGDFDSTFILLELNGLGVNIDVIDSLIPKLYEIYERRIRESQSPEYYRWFKEDWDWRSFRDQLADLDKRVKRDKERHEKRKADLRGAD